MGEEGPESSFLQLVSQFLLLIIDSIKSEITQTDDIETGMLIVANCMKVLEPRKSIPYANQAKLDWCIVGPIQNATHQNSLKCNRVAVKDTSTGNLAMHHFLIENADKDMITEQMFEQMYYNDFNEKVTQIGKIDENIEQPLKNDKRFLEILDAGTRKNWNHYEIPLLFK